MRCEDCGKEIPQDEQREVTIGGAVVQVPYCAECSEKLGQKMKDYKKEK